MRQQKANRFADRFIKCEKMLPVAICRKPSKEERAVTQAHQHGLIYPQRLHKHAEGSSDRLGPGYPPRLYGDNWVTALGLGGRGFKSDESEVVDREISANIPQGIRYLVSPPALNLDQRGRLFLRKTTNIDRIGVTSRARLTPGIKHRHLRSGGPGLGIETENTLRMFWGHRFSLRSSGDES